MMSNESVLVAPMPTEVWPAMPLDSSAIRGGNPIAQGMILTQSGDRKVSSGFWACSPGSFDWEYTWDEFVHVLEGEVSIQDQHGRTYHLGVGDTAHFPRGMKTTWEVKRAVRKFFVIRTPEPLNL